MHRCIETRYNYGHIFYYFYYTQTRLEYLNLPSIEIDVLCRLFRFVLSCFVLFGFCPFFVLRNTMLLSVSVSLYIDTHLSVAPYRIRLYYKFMPHRHNIYFVWISPSPFRLNISMIYWWIRYAKFRKKSIILYERRHEWKKNSWSKAFVSSNEESIHVLLF